MIPNATAGVHRPRTAGSPATGVQCGVVRAAALQFDVRTADVEANLDTVEQGLVRAASEGVQLVALPEMWPTSFASEEDEHLRAASELALERVRVLSAELGLVVVGSAWGALANEPLPTNRWRAFERGELVGHYDKVHLFTPTAEPASFAAGTVPPPTAPTSCGRVSGAICYDLRFPDVFRPGFRAGAELVVVSAQWPRPRASQWRALVIGRAAEGQCFVVAANRTGSARIGRRGLELEFPGNSLVVDPNGVVLAEGRGEAGLVAADLDLSLVGRTRRTTPVAKDERTDLYGSW